jgi:ABC-type transport system involved in cytochrome c biogenesis permease subunit
LLAATYVNPDPMIQARASEHVDQFFAQAEKQNPGIYPPLNLRQAEVNFNSLHPFRWAWIFALMAAIALGIALVNPIALWYRSGLVFYIVSLLWQIYGFSIRCWIAGRPPVSNMYESIIWVAFGCMFFGLLFEWIYRKRLMAIGAAIFGLIALIIADNTGAVVDDSIHPLEPVLRSNLWLTVHVLTITLGYAAYALSLVLGNLGLLPYVFLGRAAAIFPLPTLSFYSYRAVQVGTFLLTAGTILGGVWADYSWGRFWGWDPKETWALIALLGYLALIHARMFGLVNHFTFLFWAVVAFLGVLMAWYGVNFILGVGLHSYGFSSGGVGAVAAYSSIQLLLLTYAYWQYRQEKK